MKAAEVEIKKPSTRVTALQFCGRVRVPLKSVKVLPLDQRCDDKETMNHKRASPVKTRLRVDPRRRSEPAADFAALVIEHKKSVRRAMRKFFAHER